MLNSMPKPQVNTSFNQFIESTLGKEDSISLTDRSTVPEYINEDTQTRNKEES